MSVGDLVRFRFEAIGFRNEVIGEIADVVIKTETVTVFIPTPLFGNDLFPYIQAILHTKTHFIDAREILTSHGNTNHWRSQLMNETHSHLGRFDLRFGFLGGRGFTIARNAILPFTGAGTKNLQHASRIVAPTLASVTSESSRKTHITTTSNRPMHSITYWVNPLNQEQKQAVVDIVLKTHASIPYIIVGPAGTGKTLTIVESIIQILRRKPSAKILVCAPSDAACDVLACRIHPQLKLLKVEPRSHEPRYRMLRINWWARKSESLPAELLPFSSMNHLGFFSFPSRADIIKASVVICPCFVAGCLDAVSKEEPKGWMSEHFTYSFVDEVSQAMEFEVMVPLLKVRSATSASQMLLFISYMRMCKSPLFRIICMLFLLSSYANA